jgi:hypothetical protein
MGGALGCLVNIPRVGPYLFKTNPMLIRLELVRELHPHFPKSEDEISSQIHRPGASSRWHLLGANDFLVVTKIESLPMLGDIYGGGNQESSLDGNVARPRKQSLENDANYQKTLSPGGVQEWILCDPFSSDPTPTTKAYEVLSDTESGPLLIIATSFSSVYFDKLNFQDIRDKTKTIIEQITTASKDNGFAESIVLSSLGGVDLTLIIRIKDQGLKKAFVLLQQLRDLKHQVSQSRYHHCFSQVNAFFCFKDRESLSASIDNDVKIISRTRTVCGHQFDFLRRENASEDGVATHASYLTMGTYSVAQIFDGVNSLADCSTLAMKSDEYLAACKNGFDGSRTEIAMPSGLIPISARPEESEHSEITLNKKLIEFGDLIDTSVHILTNQYGSVTGREVAKALLAVRKSLTRNERLGALRDLFPFVSQLCRCIQGEAWNLLYSSKTDVRASTMSSASDLTTHLWRAIRNRIESRVESLDPSFPGTLDSGTSKLLNGYSVAAWLCSGVFNPSEKSLRCASDSFAACVAAGYSGRIQTQETFADLRRLFERADPDADIEEISRIDEAESDDRWNARLLLLDISGRAIFRPEIAFLHCMHEIAEFSEWWTQKKAIKLRVAVNEFQFSYLCDLFYNSEEFSNTKAAVHDFKVKIMQTIVFAIINLDASSTSQQVAIERMFVDQVTSKRDPTWFLLTLSQEIARLNTNSQLLIEELHKYGIDSSFLEKLKLAAAKLLLTEFAGGVEKGGSYNQHTASKEDRSNVDTKDNSVETVQTAANAEGNDIVNDRLKDNGLFQIRDLIREIVADFSMIYAIFRFRSVLIPEKRRVKDVDVDYAFGCIVEQTVSWLPAVIPQGIDKKSTKKLRDIVYRWLIQRYMVWNMENKDVDAIKDQEKVFERWREECVVQVSLAICVFDKRGEINRDVEEQMMSLVRKCMDDLEDACFAGFGGDCLAKSLAVLAVGRTPLIDEEFIKAEPARTISMKFLSVWKEAREFSMAVRRNLFNDASRKNNTKHVYRFYQANEMNSTHELEKLRMEFSWLLWAKSQKLCFDECFEVK